MMSGPEFDRHVADLSPDQASALREIRAVMAAHAPFLDESVNEGRWLNGLVFYSVVGTMVFAMGPRGKSKTVFHMMPYYGSPVLQERHAGDLSPFLTGKSCIAFRRYEDLPDGVLADIVASGAPVMRDLILGRVR
jgi:hypothetical protein